MNCTHQFYQKARKTFVPFFAEVSNNFHVLFVTALLGPFRRSRLRTSSSLTHRVLPTILSRYLRGIGMIVELCTPHAPPPRGKRWVMDTILHQQDPLLLGEHSYADRGGTITMLSRTDWDPSTALRDSVCADTTIAEHHNSIERADVQFYFPVLPNKKYTNMDEQTQTPKQDQHRPGIHKCVEPNTVRSVCVCLCTGIRSYEHIMLHLALREIPPHYGATTTLRPLCVYVTAGLMTRTTLVVAPPPRQHRH